MHSGNMQKFLAGFAAPANMVGSARFTQKETIMFKPMDLKQRAADFEQSVREYWEKIRCRKGERVVPGRAPKYVFFEGPPTANGILVFIT
jgi:isoleucyl-tRNA synthetase